MTSIRAGFAILFFLCISSINAFAKIGDTIAQCDSLYGRPQFTDANGSRGYLGWNGYALMVDFKGGIANEMSYRKMSQDSAGTSSPISGSEINQILWATHSGWKSNGVVSGFETYLTTDGKFFAAYDPVNHILEIGIK